MDNNSNGNSTKERKQANKAKKSSKSKPMKVVYISNPVMFKTSASEFRALVQELTGQDAEFPYDPTKFVDGCDDDLVGGNQTVQDAPSKVGDPSPEQPETESDQRPDGPSSAHQSFDDDPFMPQMMNFSWYGSAHVDVLTSPYAM